MNATVQCLKTVPEFRVALDKFGESESSTALLLCVEVISSSCSAAIVAVCF